MKTSDNPLHNPQLWYETIGPGRNKPEKPLDQCIRGVLRFTAQEWKIDLLASRAEYLHKRIKELEEQLRHEKENA